MYHRQKSGQDALKAISSPSVLKCWSSAFRASDSSAPSATPWTPKSLLTLGSRLQSTQSSRLFSESSPGITHRSKTSRSFRMQTSRFKCQSQKSSHGIPKSPSTNPWRHSFTASRFCASSPSSCKDAGRNRNWATSTSAKHNSASASLSMWQLSPQRSKMARSSLSRAAIAGLALKIDTVVAAPMARTARRLSLCKVSSPGPAGTHKSATHSVRGSQGALASITSSPDSMAAGTSGSTIANAFTRTATRKGARAPKSSVVVAKSMASSARSSPVGRRSCTRPACRPHFKATCTRQKRTSAGV
mmetsp:Transcript_82490/g.230003  ORF Transcript_82490/g.230003 Transcript_82490/m.230003 type:complete len:302 (-) Transcript_82490:326-1231(-)